MITHPGQPKRTRTGVFEGMNISTGGPHILLFERDQQLTALVTSEFQLAGYECHTARTAVEVFDALARYPVRIVLVDLAQAAAARREFWVALDTQRRGRGVHVLTFHCFNLAGYGPQDPEDRSQNAMADLEIDGMLGLMKLVDEVRARVPGAGSVTNTLPRIPRAAPQQTPASAPQATRSSAPPIASGTTYRPAAESPASGAPRNSTTLYPQQAASISAAPTTPAATPVNGASGISTATTTNNAPGTKPASRWMWRANSSSTRPCWPVRRGMRARRWPRWSGWRRRPGKRWR